MRSVTYFGATKVPDLGFTWDTERVYPLTALTCAQFANDLNQAVRDGDLKERTREEFAAYAKSVANAEAAAAAKVAADAEAAAKAKAEADAAAAEAQAPSPDGDAPSAPGGSVEEKPAKGGRK